MLRFKPSVRIRFVNQPLVGVLALAAMWSLRAGVDVDVNSVDDPAPDRAPTTLHGDSLAVDLDTDGDRTADLRSLATFLRRTLERPYDIVFEGDHVHVEWDVARGALPEIAG